MSHRFLLLSNFYPPQVKGGAELACAHLARWLARHGEVVGVLTLTAPDDPESTTEEEPGLTVYRRRIPNVYEVFEHLTAAPWKKPFWHALDHFHPTAAATLRAVIDDFRPDLVNTHNLTGLGYNLWNTLGALRFPVIVTCHDLTLLCLRQSMFKRDANCKTQCAVCRVSAAVRGHYVRKIERLAFVSPSRALLKSIEPVFPAHAARGIHLPNPLAFPTRSEPKPAGSVIEILYVGQVSPHKGVPFLLEVLDSLPDKSRFRLTVVGRGASLDPLRAQYAGRDWVRFAGFVPPDDVDGYMRAADVLVVPSIWYENQPLVVLQARSLGLPIMVSDQGGLPELVEDGSFGRVLGAGDPVAWREALLALTEDPTIADRWQREALARREEFAPDTLGQRFLEIADELIARPCASS